MRNKKQPTRTSKGALLAPQKEKYMYSAVVSPTTEAHDQMDLSTKTPRTTQTKKNHYTTPTGTSSVPKDQASSTPSSDKDSPKDPFATFHDVALVESHKRQKHLRSKIKFPFSHFCILRSVKRKNAIIRQLINKN